MYGGEHPAIIGDMCPALAIGERIHLIDWTVRANQIDHHILFTLANAVHLELVQVGRPNVRIQAVVGEEVAPVEAARNFQKRTVGFELERFVGVMRKSVDKSRSFEAQRINRWLCVGHAIKHVDRFVLHILRVADQSAETGVELDQRRWPHLELWLEHLLTGTFHHINRDANHRQQQEKSKGVEHFLSPQKCFDRSNKTYRGNLFTPLWTQITPKAFKSLLSFTTLISQSKFKVLIRKKSFSYLRRFIRFFAFSRFQSQFNVKKSHAGTVSLGICWNSDKPTKPLQPQTFIVVDNENLVSLRTSHLGDPKYNLEVLWVLEL